MSSKSTNGKQLKKLLPRGSQKRIARILSLQPSAVSMALDQMNPSHPAVAEALSIIEKAGTAETQRRLQALLSPPPSSSTPSEAAA